MIHEAVAITGTLAGAGMPEAAIVYWWRKPRQELGGEAPREAILDPQLRQRVIELARKDAENVRHL